MRSIIIIFMGVLLIGCSSTQQVVDPVKEKQLKEWIENKELKLVMNTASPLLGQDLMRLSHLLPQGSTSNRILLTGGDDFFSINGDTATADLPYYGTRQLGAEISQNRVGILFDEAYKKYEVKYNEKKRFYLIKMRIHTKYRESFNITAQIFLNHKAVLTINSSHRTAISYDGRVSGGSSDTVASK